MAWGPRVWALVVDSGPRGGAFEGILDPPNVLWRGFGDGYKSAGLHTWHQRPRVIQHIFRSRLVAAVIAVVWHPASHCMLLARVLAARRSAAAVGRFDKPNRVYNRLAV
jgi:hypothetical protein